MRLGSIFKMVTAVAGLKEKVVTTKTTIYDSGVYTKAGIPQKCWYYTDYHTGHGRMNVTTAIENSCNYYFYEVGYHLKIDKIGQYARAFGLGYKTGIELPYEAAGTAPSTEIAKESDGKVSPASHTSAAIGQSYNDYTPLQMAKYIAMIANSGKAVNPTIVKNVIASNGVQVPREQVDAYVNQKLGLTDENTTKDIDIDKNYIKAIHKGMKSVTSGDRGTARSIFEGFEIDVGGKTGSTEAGSWTNAWFAGFAPYDNPEIAVVVLVENGGHGNYTAEVVRDIIGEYFGMNTEKVKENMSAYKEIETYR